MTPRCPVFLVTLANGRILTLCSALTQAAHDRSFAFPVTVGSAEELTTLVLEVYQRAAYLLGFQLTSIEGDDTEVLR